MRLSRALVFACQCAAVSSLSQVGTDAFVRMVGEANVKRTVNDIMVKSAVLQAMSDAGEIKMVGAMLDAKTDAVTWD